MPRGRPSTRGEKRWGSVTIALGLLALMASPPAEAADFTVNPVQIFLSRQNPSAILTVQNTSTEPLRFQLNAFSWAQDQAGQMVLTPTSEVIFFPRLLSLVSGEQRIVRVGVSVPPGPVERTYRIFVEELPPVATQSAPAGQVRVLARMGIPIFLEPRTGRTELRLTPPTLGPGQVVFELRNTGTKHAIPQEIRVRGLGPTGEAIWTREPEGWYVLAGDRRVYGVPVSREDCARTKTIAVEVKAGEQVLAERLDVAAAACGP
ncbi:MAG TPA: fimbria/pilus periplasmic chaperone [Methylomirabilota bacterium]